MTADPSKPPLLSESEMSWPIRSRAANVCLFALILVLASGASAQLSDACPSYTYWGNLPGNTDNPDWSESAQGVANDGEYWFFTQKVNMYKYERNWRSVGGPDEGRLIGVGIPDVLSGPGTPEGSRKCIDHYGDLDQYRGYLFVPFEGGSCVLNDVVVCKPGCLVPTEPNAIIAVFRTSDLTLVDWVDISDVQVKTGWAAVNPVDGLLYTSGNELTATDPIYRYAIDFEALEDGEQGGFLTLVDAMPVLEADGTPVEGVFTFMQGGVFSPWEDLYIAVGKSTGEPEEVRGGLHLLRYTADRTAFRVVQSSVNRDDAPSPPSPVFAYDYNPTAVGGEEPEGIDWWNQTNVPDARYPGQLHAILLSLDTFGDDGIWWKHYTSNYFCKFEDDSDGDGVGDFEEAYVLNTHPLIPDSDWDGTEDDLDNCPDIANADQLDLDADGLGDACDPDVDGDGQSNADEEACGSNPSDAASKSPDFDEDAAPDCVDPDDDNDSVDDEIDVCPQTIIPDPVIPASGDLKNNRYALVDDDLVFDRATAENPTGEVFTTADTGGCNATQIAIEMGLGKSHFESGISRSVLRSWSSRH